MFNPSDMEVLLAKIEKEQWKPIKQFAKEYTKDPHRYDDVFKSKRLNRIYLREDNPITAVDPTEDTYIFDNANDINDLIQHYWYANTVAGINMTKHYYKKINYEQYINNEIFDSSERQTTIGKFFVKYEQLLKRIREEQLKKSEDSQLYYDTLYKKDLEKLSTIKRIFNCRGNKKIKQLDLIVCISRSPFDIASMSTGQRWTSCQELPYDIDILMHYIQQITKAITMGQDSENYLFDRENYINKLKVKFMKKMGISSKDSPEMWSFIMSEIHKNESNLGKLYGLYRFVFGAIRQGCLIAYLIDKNDKDLDHPYCRYMINPYFKQNGGDWIVLAEYDKKYDDLALSVNIYEQFLETIEKWTQTVNGDKPDGLYNKAENIYDDNMIKTFRKMSTKIKKQL